MVFFVKYPLKPSVRAGALPLADGLGAELCAVVVGSGIEGIAGELEKYGPDKILVADDPALADYTTSAYTNVIADLIQSADAAVVVLGASAQVRSG